MDDSNLIDDPDCSSYNLIECLSQATTSSSVTIFSQLAKDEPTFQDDKLITSRRYSKHDSKTDTKTTGLWRRLFFMVDYLTLGALRRKQKRRKRRKFSS